MLPTCFQEFLMSFLCVSAVATDNTLSTVQCVAHPNIYMQYELFTALLPQLLLVLK